jgi:hypothetical protein
MMTDAVSGLPPNLSKCYKTYLLSRTCPQLASVTCGDSFFYGKTHLFGPSKEVDIKDLG